MEAKTPETKIFAVGTVKGNPVVFAFIDGRKVVIPTNLVTMAKLAETLPIRNEE